MAFPSVGKGPALAGQDDRGSRPHAPARCPVRSRRRGCRRHHRAGEGSPSTDHGIRRRDRHTPATTPKPGNTGPGKFSVQEPDRFGLLDGGMPDRRWTPRNAGRFLGQADSAVAERGSRQSDQPKDRSVTMPRLGLRLTPRRHILLEAAEDAPVLDDRIAERLADAFARGTGHGLLQLERARSAKPCRPPSSGGANSRRATWGRCACTPRARPEAPSSPVLPAVPPPTDGRTRHIRADGPDDAGGGISDRGRPAWRCGHELGAAFATASLAAAKPTCRTSSRGSTRPGIWSAACISISPRTAAIRNARSPSWRPTPRGCRPQAKAQHLPLGQALREYAGAANKDQLLSLLLPVQRAAETLRLAQGRWSMRARSFIRCAGRPREALQLLTRRARPGRRRRGRAHAGRVARRTVRRARR